MRSARTSRSIATAAPRGGARRCSGVRSIRKTRPGSCSRPSASSARAGAKGKRSGPLGFVALEVLRDLLRLIDYRTGRLEPSIETLMGRLRRSRDAIVRALANLRTHGFLDWLRRWEPTGALNGPKVKQATNAYRLVLPPAAARLLGFLASPPPEPDDASAAREARKAAQAAMIAALPLDEQPAASGLSGPLAAALARLGRGVMSRSASPPRRTESQLSSS